METTMRIAMRDLYPTLSYRAALMKAHEDLVITDGEYDKEISILDHLLLESVRRQPPVEEDRPKPIRTDDIPLTELRKIVDPFECQVWGVMHYDDIDSNIDYYTPVMRAKAIMYLTKCGYYNADSNTESDFGDFECSDDAG